MWARNFPPSDISTLEYCHTCTFLVWDCYRFYMQGAVNIMILVINNAQYSRILCKAPSFVNITRPFRINIHCMHVITLYSVCKCTAQQMICSNSIMMYLFTCPGMSLKHYGMWFVVIFYSHHASYFLEVSFFQEPFLWVHILVFLHTDCMWEALLFGCCYSNG